MSTFVSTESSREILRREHGVRLVTPAEEGSSAADLPAGVYGFTSSPVLASPLFAQRRYRNFEIHRLAAGPAVIGFVTAADAAAIAHPSGDTVTVRVYPDAEGDATSIVCVSYDRIVHHRQYSVLNAEAAVLQIAPTTAMSI